MSTRISQYTGTVQGTSFNILGQTIMTGTPNGNTFQVQGRADFYGINANGTPHAPSNGGGDAVVAHGDIVTFADILMQGGQLDLGGAQIIDSQTGNPTIVGNLGLQDNGGTPVNPATPSGWIQVFINGATTAFVPYYT